MSGPVAGGDGKCCPASLSRASRATGRRTLKLAPLTVLIGANASGKSNAVEALRLLSWLAQGNKLGSIRYAVQEGDQALRGTVRDLTHRNRGEFSLSCLTTHPKWGYYSITLQIQDDDDLHITDERLIGPDQNVPLFEVVSSQESGGGIRVAYNNFARGGRKPQVVCIDQLAVLVQLESSARFESGQRTAQRVIPEVTTQYQEWLSNIVFLDPLPSTMRGYSFKAERTLSGNGANLSRRVVQPLPGGEHRARGSPVHPGPTGAGHQEHRFHRDTA